MRDRPAHHARECRIQSSAPHSCPCHGCAGPCPPRSRIIAHGGRTGTFPGAAAPRKRCTVPTTRLRRLGASRSAASPHAPSVRSVPASPRRGSAAGRPRARRIQRGRHGGSDTGARLGVWRRPAPARRGRTRRARRTRSRGRSGRVAWSAKSTSRKRSTHCLQEVRRCARAAGFGVGDTAAPGAVASTFTRR